MYFGWKPHLEREYEEKRCHPVTAATTRPPATCQTTTNPPALHPPAMHTCCMLTMHPTPRPLHGHYPTSTCALHAHLHATVPAPRSLPPCLTRATTCGKPECWLRTSSHATSTPLHTNGNLLPSCSIASHYPPPPLELTLLCHRHPCSHMRTLALPQPIGSRPTC